MKIKLIWFKVLVFFFRLFSVELWIVKSMWPKAYVNLYLIGPEFCFNSTERKTRNHFSSCNRYYVYIEQDIAMSGRFIHIDWHKPTHCAINCASGQQVVGILKHYDFRSFHSSSANKKNIVAVVTFILNVVVCINRWHFFLIFIHSC